MEGRAHPPESAERELANCAVGKREDIKGQDELRNKMRGAIKRSSLLTVNYC